MEEEPDEFETEGRFENSTTAECVSNLRKLLLSHGRKSRQGLVSLAGALADE